MADKTAAKNIAAKVWIHKKPRPGVAVNRRMVASLFSAATIPFFPSASSQGDLTSPVALAQGS